MSRSTIQRFVGNLILALQLLAFTWTLTCAVRLQTECKDLSAECQSWAKRGECGLNPYFMRRQCRQACMVCGRASAPHVWKGFATESGTRMYVAALPGLRYPVGAGHFRKDLSMGSYDTPGQKVRGSPWLTLSSIGTGTYLGNEDPLTDEQVTCAIVVAIFHGMNIIDTASNYRSGRGQAAVGEAVQALLDSKRIAREALFFSTKAGFMEAKTLQMLLSAKAITQRDITGSHCIHPACLKASLTESLRAMHLHTVDLLYLHNVAEMRASQVSSLLFRQLLADAFVWLEQERKAGRIRAYGLATWSCFRVPPGSDGHLSLQEIVHMARDIGGLHHGFRYIQLPINAGMLEAIVEPWQIIATEAGSRQLTVLEAASELGVGVFASGPLQEGALLKNHHIRDSLSKIDDLADGLAYPGQLLQLARSIPLLVAAIIGHKTEDHVRETVELVKRPALESKSFVRIVNDLKS